MVCSPTQAGVGLAYHHVDTDTPAITSITPQQFQRHLEILEDEGFTILPLAEMTARSLSGESQDEKLAAITFDDAYISVYEHALPLLKARGWPFTVFVATEALQTTNPIYMTWAQLAELTKHGGTIANHSHSHGHLIRRQPEESDESWLERVRQDIETASRILRTNGFDSNEFAFPYGEYNSALLTLVSELGMVGYGQHSGAIGPSSNPAVLPRFPLSGVYVGEAAFREKIRSLAMPVRFPEIDPLTEEVKPALELQSDDAALNLSRMTCYGPGGLMPLTKVSNTHLIATAVNEIPVGRSKYNCTLPSHISGRYYWFSQLWIRKKADGTWYQEP